MTTNLRVNDRFPDVELPNQRDELTQLSKYIQPTSLDEHLGFLDGYPLILILRRKNGK